jgi:anti-sigma factor RsiW
MSGHVKETNLALFVSGDLSLFERAAVRLHLSGCQDCRARVETYRFDRQRLKEDAAQVPAGVDWDRLAQEMTANIRVGLAAGECVAPRSRKQTTGSWWRSGWGWRPAAAMAGVAMILSAAWWLNLPSADTASLGRAIIGPPAEDRGPIVAATANGIELRENGSSLVMSQGATVPGFVSVSAQGTASASYVNDAGEITLTGVYVQ